MSKGVLRIPSVVVFVALLGAPIRAHVLYVDDSAPPGGDGSSWSLALDDLALALNGSALPDVEQIWVAEGRYLPSATDPGASFVLPDGVLVYGGFAGTETSLDQRDPAAHPTLLDGDLNGDDQPDCVGYADNSFHVVTDTGGASSHLDGFIVRGGRVGPGAGLSLTAEQVTLSRLVLEQNCAMGGTNTGGGAETSASFVVVEDCAFRDNEASGGGGMMLRIPQAASFSNCIFERNEGAGVSTTAPRSVSFSSCVFEENDAGVGMTNAREALFSNCIFERNRAGGAQINGSQVGQVRFADCWFLDGGTGIDFSPHAFISIEIDRCTFEGNDPTIGAAGGGAIIQTLTRGTATVRDSVFRGNVATGGAGLYIYAGTHLVSISSTISGCLFEDNRACAGGGIFTNTGPTVVERCVFRNNQMLLPNPFPCGLGTGGGAIRADQNTSRVEISSSSFSQSEHSLLWAEEGAQVRAELCTFSNAGTSAPAIRLRGPSSVELASCIAWGDAASQVQIAAMSSVSAAFSDVRQGGAGLPGTGNLEADPLFVDAAGHDLRLMPGSPCIEAGDPAVLPSGPDAGTYSRLTDGDLDSIARVDMGGHEATPIELAITGVPAPGNTLTIETSGQPGLAAFLAVDRPGPHFFPRWGTLFTTLTGGFLSHWPSAPSTTNVTVPPGVAGLYHAQLIVVESGALAFSNYVPLSF